MQTLHADGLVLEPLVPAHAEAMYAILRDPQLYAYIDHPPPPSLEHLRGVYTQVEGRWSPDRSQQWLNWVLRTPADEVVGYVQTTIGPSASAWVAYMLGRPHWGRGYATLAVRCMMAHVVEAYAVRGFFAVVEQANHASIAVLGRLGFVPATADEAAPHGLTATERLFVAEAVRTH